jgi:penicillin-binding protein 1B
LPQFSDTKPFVPPAGVLQVQLDRNTNLLADATCPDDYTAAFLDGTQPTDSCDHSMGDQRNLFQKIFGLGQKPVNPPPPVQATKPAQPPGQASPPQPSVAQNQGQQPAEDEKPKKKPGFWGRLFGKKDSSQQQQQNPPQ